MRKRVKGKKEIEAFYEGRQKGKNAAIKERSTVMMDRRKKKNERQVSLTHKCYTKAYKL